MTRRKTEKHFSLDYRDARFSERFKRIRNAYGATGPDDKELLRYFPIAAAACVESCFRLWIKILIDSSVKYLWNSKKLSDQKKFGFDDVKGIGIGTLTVGDIIARRISVSDAREIEGSVEQITGISLRQEISRLYDERAWPEYPRVSDAGEIYPNVAKTFSLREIFCRESASAFEITPDEVEKCLDGCEVFLILSERFIEQAIFHGDSPEIASHKECENEERQIGSLLEELFSLLSKEQKAKLEEANEAWNVFVEESAEIEWLRYEGWTHREVFKKNAVLRFLLMRKTKIEESIRRLHRNESADLGARR